MGAHRGRQERRYLRHGELSPQHYAAGTSTEGRIAAHGFIPAETLVKNGAAGDNNGENGTAGGTLKPVSTGVSGRMKPPLDGFSSGNVYRLHDT